MEEKRGREEEKSFECNVSSFQEYVSIVSEIAEPYEGRQMIGTKLLYRGQANKDWKLLPKVARGKQFESQVALFDYERNLIEEAKYRMPEVFRSDMIPVDLLALLQHYGIPTRLLDVSASPLVALFFACNNDKTANTDGEVIVFKRDNEHNETYPLHNAVADSYRIIGNATCSLERFFDELLLQPYAIEKVWRLKALYETQLKKEMWIHACCTRIIFVRSKEFAVRQKVQQGEYLLFPNKIKKALDRSLNFVNLIDPIEKKEGLIAKRIIISSEAKNEILKELNAIGINEGFLFCDSVEATCKQIERDIRRMI